MAIQTCVLTAFRRCQRTSLIRRFCLIHLKNNSTCQRHLYSFAMVKRVEDEVVGEENQALARFGIDILDPAQRNRIFARRLRAGEIDGLIAAESRGFVDGAFRVARHWRLFLARVTKKAMFI